MGHAGELVWSIELQKSDVEGNLYWPTGRPDRPPNFNGHYKVHFVVADGDGHSWRFRCSKPSRGSHPKPLVDNGDEWRDFVKRRELIAGDQLSFYDSKVPGVDFTVRVVKKRTIKILGKQIEGANEA